MLCNNNESRKNVICVVIYCCYYCKCGSKNVWIMLLCWGYNTLADFKC
uniref:Uncharacterized protein n=1 Tax=Bombyx mori TaxID=7091 RepID=Q8MTQ2_BOMMO|nr:putative protein [Bombyx mori]